MISFRYHLASLVAVLLALAAGVALGAGPLREDGERPAADVSATGDSTAAPAPRRVRCS